MNVLDSRFLGNVDIDVGLKFGQYAVSKRGAGSWEQTQFYMTIDEVADSVRTIADNYHGSAGVHVDLRDPDIIHLKRVLIDNRKISVYP